MTQNSNTFPAAQEHYASVQLLRFVAAMMVVLMHTTEAMAQRMPAFRDLPMWTTGGGGVDIFFVISGFVMAISSRAASVDASVNYANAIDFFKRRILRVVPLYWFYTILKIASVLILPALALRTTLQPGHLFASFFFLPWISPWGLIQPVLPVGWTLNFEMLFYLCFAIAMALNFNRLLFCMAVFIALYIAGHIFPDTTALAFYGNTLLFEFGIGMLIARLCTYRVHLAWALLLVVAGIFLIGQVSRETDRLFHQGIGAGLLIMGALQLEGSAAIKAALEKVTVLGDISYSSYLCHSFLVPFTVALLAYLHVEIKGVIIAATLLAVVAGSLASYFGLERPMTKALKAVFFRKAVPSGATQRPAPTQMGNL